MHHDPPNEPQPDPSEPAPEPEEPLTPAQLAFARLLGRLLAERWAQLHQQPPPIDDSADAESDGDDADT